MTIDGRIKKTIDDMIALAKKHNAICVSKIYKDSMTPMNWKCENGHHYRKPASDIMRRGIRCQQCKKDRNLKRVQDKAKELGGECLSKRFNRMDDKYKFKCKEGHIWKASPNNMLRHNNWCIYCAGVNLKTIKDIRGYAKEKGGKLISKEYKGVLKPHIWECYNGHQFKMSPSKVHSRGQWCPTCSAGLGERITRLYFETIFKKQFPRAKPDWLRNKKGNKLELDGYCEKLKLAFEYQGTQHYETMNVYVTNKDELKERKRVDRKKVRECKKRGITLLQIPEIDREFELSEFKMFLKNMLIDNGVIIPINYDSIKIDIKKAYTNNGYYEILKKFVEDKGGKLISKYYVNSSTKLTFKCDKGHKWNASPNKIKMGRWCPTCKGGVRLTKKITGRPKNV